MLDRRYIQIFPLTAEYITFPIQNIKITVTTIVLRLCEEDIHPLLVFAILRLLTSCSFQAFRSYFKLRVKQVACRTANTLNSVTCA